jgi:hypothetical protein
MSPSAAKSLAIVLSFADQIVLEALNINTTEPQRSPLRVVKWNRPEIGEFKINTDGASKGNPGTSGGG